MTVRDDIYVLFGMSPRIAVVSSPSDKFAAGDLLDTLRNIEAQPQNSNDDDLIAIAGGGEDLGEGVQVGLTLTLNNLRVAFEAKTQSKQSGSATTGDSGGTVLIDTSAAFITNGVEPGATIINFTDKSVATVLQVISETELRHFKLDDGSGNDWEVGDEYKIWNVEQCDAAGGNLSAIDGLGQPLSPIFPTAFTQANKTASSSATYAAGDPSTIADAVWDEQLSGHVVAGSSGKALGDVENDTVALLDLLNQVLDHYDNKMVINKATSELWLYDDGGTSVIKKWPLTDKDGNNVVLIGTGPVNRDKRTL